MAVLLCGVQLLRGVQTQTTYVVADALSRRPDFDSAAQSNSGVDTTVATLVTSVPSSTMLDDIKRAYAEDRALLRLMDHLVTPYRKPLKDLPALYRSSAEDRYTTHNGLLYYTAVAGDTPRVVVPTHSDLRLRIMYGCHDAPPSGIVDVRRLISRQVATFTGLTSISSCASTFMLVSCANG